MHEYDFKPYTEPKDMKDFDGVISPEGIFYRVKPMDTRETGLTHYGWAHEFLKDFPDVDKCVNEYKLNSRLYFLIHFLGYVRYGHYYGKYGVFIHTPNSNFCGKKITREQIDTVKKVMDVNHEKPYEDENFLFIDKQPRLSDTRRKSI